MGWEKTKENIIKKQFAKIGDFDRYKQTLDLE